MSLVVLLILALLWAAFLVPRMVQARADKTPADSVGAFRHQLSILERTSPSFVQRPVPPTFGAAAPSSRRSHRELVRVRRRNILLGLLGAAGVTLLLGLVVPVLLTVNLVLDVLFVAYCALLVRARNLGAEREMKVRYLPGPRLAPEPLLLRRSGS